MDISSTYCSFYFNFRMLKPLKTKSLASYSHFYFIATVKVSVVGWIPLNTNRIYQSGSQIDFTLHCNSGFLNRISKFVHQRTKLVEIHIGNFSIANYFLVHIYKAKYYPWEANIHSRSKSTAFHPQLSKIFRLLWTINYIYTNKLSRGNILAIIFLNLFRSSKDRY